MPLGDGRVDADGAAAAAARAQPRAPRARFQCAGARGRHRGERGDVGCDRRQWPAAVRARALRGSGWRAVAAAPPRAGAASIWRSRVWRRRGRMAPMSSRWSGCKAAAGVERGTRAGVAGRSGRCFSAGRAPDAGARPRARARVPGRGVCRAVPAAPGACARCRARKRSRRRRTAGPPRARPRAGWRCGWRSTTSCGSLAQAQAAALGARAPRGRRRRRTTC